MLALFTYSPIVYVQKVQMEPEQVKSDIKTHQGDSIRCALPAKLSAWAEFKRSMSNVIRVLLCGCYSAEGLANFEADDHFRSCVREHMRKQEVNLEEGVKPLEHALVASVKEDGYVLGDWHTIEKANEGIKRTQKEWDVYFQRLGVDPKTRNTTGMRCARLVPRFVTACVFAMRAKPGIGRECNEDNLRVATREYHKICKNHGVHSGDEEHHMQSVLNAFFTEDIAGKLGRSRSAAPKWLKWLYDVQTPSTSKPIVC